MKHLGWISTFIAVIILVDCTHSFAVETVTLQCGEKAKTSSFSFEMGVATTKKDADITLYFDGDDCSQGAIFGQDDRKGFIFPVGHKQLSELSLAKGPQAKTASVLGLFPITKDKEGLAFWIKTKRNRYVLARIKNVQPASFSQFKEGGIAEVGLEWAWAADMKKSASAKAKNSKYDLSTPERAYKSFFTAVNNADEKGLTKLVSPDILAAFSSGEFTIQEFIEVWSQPQGLKIGSPTLHNDLNGEKFASARAWFNIDGEKHSSSFRVKFIDGSWLWDEK